MINKGKAVLASLASAPKGNVQVVPPETTAASAGQYGFTARPGWEGSFVDDIAANLTKWVNGDLSFLATGAPVRPDKDKRKRDAMADVLDGKK